MAQIRPFRAIRPTAGYEAQIAALPYDVFSLEEAKAEVDKEPLSFLSIDLPELSAAPGEDIYQRAGRLLRERREKGYFMREDAPCYYLYEQSAGGRSQTGICALTRVDDYLNGSIKRHENTRAEKEADRVAHVDGCRAQTGPIFLAYRSRTQIRELTARIRETQTPIYDFVSADGVGHRVWRVDDKERMEEIAAAFGQVDTLYIADGHHRCAAAAACAEKYREQNPSYSGEEPWNFILSVLFPDEELRILDYNRVVKDLNGLSAKQLLSRLEECFLVSGAQKQPPRLTEKGQFGMYLEGAWYFLQLKDAYKDSDPVEGLDVSVLQNRVLAPIFQILKPRTDKRIDFVGGIRGFQELVRRVDLEGGAAFLMYPTSLAELFAVADAGRLMPPKSTWFEPKLRSGLLISGFEDGEDKQARPDRDGKGGKG